MEFDESFFKAEEIEGFYVTGMMKRYWASSMECLAEIDRICRKYRIRYFVYYGTLLGAVRHKGYIPWDDDMDIVMIREDFNKFIKACDKEKDPMFVLYNVEHSSVYPTRFSNTLYTRMDEAFLEKFHGCPYPSGVDIYVLDKVPTDPVEKEAVKLLHQVVRYMAQRTDGYFNFVRKDATEILTEDDIEEVLRGIEEFTGEKFVRDDTLFIQLTKLANRICMMYNDTKSPYYARIFNWAIRGDKRECLPVEWFSKTVYLPFFNMEVPCPVAYHEVLAKIKGADYMTPKKFLSAHQYPVYKKKQQELEDIYKMCNQEPPAFLYE